MNINRNNYEEYFLLYADNELTPVEKKVVEIFVQENPDLKKEFLMFQLTVSKPDPDVQLSDKSFLMKQEPEFISENNFEQAFVLYHDQELSEEDKQSTENFLNKYPQFRNEFELIGQAHLAPDTSIQYPAKKKLYRKENNRKVIPIVWKYMAAAAFIGFGLFISISYYNGKQEVPVIANNGKTMKPLSTLPSEPQKEEPAVKLPLPEPAAVEHNKAVEDNKNEAAQSYTEVAIAPVSKIVTAPALVKINEKKKIPGIQNPVIVPDDLESKLLAAKEPLQNVPAPKSNNLPVPNSHIDVEQHVQTSDYAQTASYAINNNNNSNDENYVFYNVKADEFNKTKVGGFLKKVKRIVERTNPIARLISKEDNLASN
jgi:hypothetical protein